MSLSYSIHVRCACPEGQKCPKLWRRDGTWNPRHGSAGWAARIPTSAGVKLVKRFGFERKDDAREQAGEAGTLLALATTEADQRAIGDIIWAAKRGMPLPSEANVRRRLSLGQAPGDAGITCGQAWSEWLAGKKRLRESSHDTLEGIGEYWLLPVIADVPLERLSSVHCAAVFDRVEKITEAILEVRRQTGSNAWVKVLDDVRSRPRPIGVATQHRIFAALREWINYEVRKTHRLRWNPIHAVELEPEEREEAQRWSAAETRTFLAAARDNRYGRPGEIMYRIIVLHGTRRAEAVGLQWEHSDLDEGYIEVVETILHLKRGIVKGKPKTRTSKRRIWLDAQTMRMLREHRKDQLAQRLRAGPAWEDNDLIFCDDGGVSYNPDHVRYEFKRIARGAGLRAIRLHEGRHTAASLGRDAGVDADIRRERLGHADAAMTRHYTHIEAEAHRAAAEAVARLVDGDEESDGRSPDVPQESK